jgi:rhamnulokinase
MVERIQTHCRMNSHPAPIMPGEIVRCILESLALEYRWVAEKLRELSGMPLPVIHIIGGGSRNQLLNQFTADATGCRVVAGPVEATAVGNILVQALALGQIGSLSEGRALVRRSFDVTEYYPGSGEAWDEAYRRYCDMKAKQLS